MLRQFQFGLNSAVAYAPRRGLYHCAGPPVHMIADARARAAEILESPLEFPPLAKAVVPGDKVVLALAPEVPQATSLVAATVEAILHGGAAPDDITVLRTQDDTRIAANDPRSDLPNAIRSNVRLETHHPLSRQDLAYLGADDYGEPIYVSRHVFDADVVVPIGCARLDEALGYGGVNATLYPTFADQNAYERCRTAVSNGHGAHDSKAPSRRTRERAKNHAARTPRNQGRFSQRDAEHVAWLLGVVFCVQAVPGTSGDLIDVLAGRYEHVMARGRELCREAWSCDVPAPADLVVAAIEGDAAQQTWDNVGRAIAAAQRIVGEKGAIALCTELAEEPGPGIRAVGGAENLDQAQRRLQKQKPLDAPAAQQWASALDHTRLYLLSRLGEELVEDIGAAHVANATEIARLIENTPSCVLLSNAQYVLPIAVEKEG